LTRMNGGAVQKVLPPPSINSKVLKKSAWIKRIVCKLLPGTNTELMKE